MTISDDIAIVSAGLTAATLLWRLGRAGFKIAGELSRQTEAAQANHVLLRGLVARVIVLEEEATNRLREAKVKAERDRDTRID